MFSSLRQTRDDLVRLARYAWHRWQERRTEFQRRRDDLGVLSAESHAYWMKRVENSYRNGTLRRDGA